VNLNEAEYCPCEGYLMVTGNQRESWLMLHIIYVIVTVLKLTVVWQLMRVVTA